MADITAARINNLQSRVELILGNGSERNGYGQTVTSVQVVPNSIIDADHLNNIYTDIVKARIHQVGVSDPSISTISEVIENLNVIADETSFTVSNEGTVADDPAGTKKGIDDFEDLMQRVEVDKQLMHPSQATLEQENSNQRTTVWNGKVFHTFLITFNDANARRHFFNAGGQIRIDPSNVNASTPKGLDWAALLNEIGIITFDSDSTSSTSFSGLPIGNFNLTTEYQTIFFKSGTGYSSGVYAGNRITVKAKVVGDTQLQFNVEFNDLATDNSIDNNVTGTLTNSVRIYRASGTNVSVPTPGFTTLQSLSEQGTGNDPLYILTASTATVNEGSPFSITLSTRNVASGTTIPYTITGVSASDLNTGSLTGNFVLDANGVNVASFLVMSDNTTEGTEAFTLSLDNFNVNATVTILDTSPNVPTPEYNVSVSSQSIDEGGQVQFILNTSNVSNGTTVPFTISGIDREDLTRGGYTWDDWFNEFETSGTYWPRGTYTRSQILARKELILPYYEGNQRYNTPHGRRYGLFRRADANGIAYWVGASLNGNRIGQDFTDDFFDAVQFGESVRVGYADNITDATELERAQTSVKPFLFGTSSDFTNTYDWDDWFDEFAASGAPNSPTRNWGGASKAEVLAAKDFVLNIYQGNEDVAAVYDGTGASASLSPEGAGVVLNNGNPLYGFFRKPKANGIAYWTNEIVVNGLNREWVKASMFNSALEADVAGTAVVQADGQTDAARIKTADKIFLYSQTGTVVQDRGDITTVVGNRGAVNNDLDTNLEGSFYVQSGTAVKTYAIKNDYSAGNNPDGSDEGTEIMTLSLNNGLSSASTTIFDTSRADNSDGPPPVTPGPSIKSFSWNRNAAAYGDPLYVVWSVDNAEEIFITFDLPGQAIAPFRTSDLAGSTTVFNAENVSGDARAVISATGPGGTKTSSTTITISGPSPTINYFYPVDGDGIVLSSNGGFTVGLNEPVKFAYGTSNATSIQIVTNFGQTYSSPGIPPSSGNTGTFQFSEPGTKTATLTATNDDGATISKSSSFIVEEDGTVTSPPEWAYYPQWRDLGNTTILGTSGRGYAGTKDRNADITYSITGPSRNVSITSLGPENNEQITNTPVYTFSKEGPHRLEMTATTPGGTITLSDTVNVVSDSGETYEITPKGTTKQFGEIIYFVISTQNVPLSTNFGISLTNGDFVATKITSTGLSDTGVVQVPFILQENINSNGQSEQYPTGTYTVRLYKLGNSTVLDSTTLTVTALNPSYAVAPTALTVSQGDTAEYVLTTTNIDNNVNIITRFTNNSDNSEIYTTEDLVSNNAATIQFSTAQRSTGTYSVEFFNTTFDNLVASATLTITLVPSTYTLTPQTASTIAGVNPVLYSLSTTNVSNGTLLYVTLDKASSGTQKQVGTVTVNNNFASVQVNTLAADPVGSDYSVNIKIDGYDGQIVETAGLTIAAPPTYTISPQDAVINADQQEFYTITTTNVADGTVLYWHIGTSANAAVADASGQVTITNNTAQFAYTPSSTELAAVMDLYVKTDGQGGTAVATTGVTVVIQSGA